MTCPSCSSIQANIDYDSAAIAYDRAALALDQSDLVADQMSLSYHQGLFYNCGCSGPEAVPGRVPLSEPQLQKMRDDLAAQRQVCNKLLEKRDAAWKYVEEMQQARDAAQ